MKTELNDEQMVAWSRQFSLESYHKAKLLVPQMAKWWKKQTNAGHVVKAALAQYGLNWIDNV